MGSAGIAQLVEQLICNSRKGFARVFIGLRTVADASYLSHFGFTPHCAELRRFAHKIFQTVEDHREKFGRPVRADLCESRRGGPMSNWSSKAKISGCKAAAQTPRAEPFSKLHPEKSVEDDDPVMETFDLFTAFGTRSLLCV
jgi:hypothetical protein